MYDLVLQLGQTLRDSRPTCDDRNNYYPPLINLSKDNQDILEKKIMDLTKRISKYLDGCGMRMPKPLWQYERSNPDSHISSSQFKYADLVV